MPKPPNTDQIKGLIDALKVLLRRLGVRQTDLAAQLGISRATLKRRMSGKGLTVVALNQLCDVAGVTMGELYELANANTDPRPRRLASEQEGALHADVRLGFIFTRLQLGWTAEEIQRECRIGQAPLVAYLIRLEKLGLIDLLPGNRVRLRTARDIEWRRHGPMWHSVDRYLKDIFDMTDSDDPELSRRVAVVKLSAASVAQIDELFHAVQTQVRRLADNDRSVLADDKAWYAVLLGARPFELDLGAKTELPWRRRTAKPKAKKRK